MRARRLSGVCKSFHPTREWKRREWAPGAKSVFAAGEEQEGQEQNQDDVDAEVCARPLLLRSLPAMHPFLLELPQSCLRTHARSALHDASLSGTVAARDCTIACAASRDCVIPCLSSRSSIRA